MKDQQQNIEVLRKKLQKHVQGYPIKITLPANIFGVKAESEADTTSAIGSESDDPNQFQQSYKENSVPFRTSEDLINFRLLDADINFFSDEPTPLSEVQTSLNDFVSDLESTGCYDSVKVILGRPGDRPSSSTERQVDVILQEKNWYKLYVGGGLKQDQNSLLSSSGMMPKVQFETSASLINLAGITDITQFNYALDQTSTPTISLMHSRPLYTMFGGSLGDTILNMDQGSKFGFTMKATIDTLDFENIRSSKDHIQKLGLKIANSTTGSSSSSRHLSGSGIYSGMEWSLSHRDMVPRRHTTIPYQYDASPDIVAVSGPNLKHSVLADFSLNGYLTDDRFQPTAGIDAFGGIEVAGPPGDVGFMKLWFSSMLHIPLLPWLRNEEKKNAGFLRRFLNGLASHTVFHGGIMKGLDFGGLCSSSETSVSDHFYVGGSHQLRGFLPAGIGPRAAIGGASTPGGDSMGGDVFYAASQSLSLPFPNAFLSQKKVRIFGFTNVGTLSSFSDAVDIRSFLNSSRVAFGLGASAALPFGRLEATYSVPYRFGPQDGRRAVQGGIGFNFG